MIARLREAVPLELREASEAGEYLEGVLARADLDRCCQILGEALGPPAKPFGASSKQRLGPQIRKALEKIGGVRDDQCLYLAHQPDSSPTYATLWPWASDGNRVTLKVGRLEQS